MYCAIARKNQWSPDDDSRWLRRTAAASSKTRFDSRAWTARVRLRCELIFFSSKYPTIFQLQRDQEDWERWIFRHRVVKIRLKRVRRVRDSCSEMIFAQTFKIIQDVVYNLQEATCVQLYVYIFCFFLFSVSLTWRCLKYRSAVLR